MGLRAGCTKSPRRAAAAAASTATVAPPPPSAKRASDAVGVDALCVTRHGARSPAYQKQQQLVALLHRAAPGMRLRTGQDWGGEDGQKKSPSSLVRLKPLPFRAKDSHQPLPNKVKLGAGLLSRLVASRLHAGGRRRRGVSCPSAPRLHAASSSSRNKRASLSLLTSSPRRAKSAERIEGDTMMSFLLKRSTLWCWEGERGGRERDQSAVSNMLRLPCRFLRHHATHCTPDPL